MCISFAKVHLSLVVIQVIQAVTTYKSLSSFVSTTLFNRLIIKKVWTNPPLWQGFIRCAKLIAPASYAALLQLPKEQLRDVVERQPGLKVGLREHVVKNARGNRARMSGYMDIFGEEGATPAAGGTPIAAGASAAALPAPASTPAPAVVPESEAPGAGPGAPQPES
jgi:symplekin